MSTIKFTVEYEIETSHYLDSDKAWALIIAANEGAEANLDNESILTIKSITNTKMETPLEMPVSTTKDDECAEDEDGIQFP